MYFTHTKYQVMPGEPHLGSMVESDLIEAPGEAEDIFFDNCLANGYAEQCFTAIDDVSELDIELDITDYIGDKAFRLLESTLELLDEDEELTETKLNSRYVACTMKRKR